MHRKQGMFSIDIVQEGIAFNLLTSRTLKKCASLSWQSWMDLTYVQADL